MIRFFAALLCATLVSGCGTQKYVKMHEDALPPGQKPALVKPVAFVIVSNVDGNKTNINPSGGLTTEYELEFVPGEHVLQLQYNSGLLLSRDVHFFRMRVESGRKYIIKPIVIDRRWRAELIDVTDRPQCWKISVGTTFGPQGCD